MKNGTKALVKELIKQGPPMSYCMNRSELHCERTPCTECKKEWAREEAAKRESSEV